MIDGTNGLDLYMAEDRSTGNCTAEQMSRNAGKMSLLIIVSRLTGFLRTWGQAFALGVSGIASCYSIANNLPNQLYELVVGGMLVTAFLPVYVSEKARNGSEGASRYASNLVTIVSFLMLAVSVVSLELEEVFVF